MESIDPKVAIDMTCGNGRDTLFLSNIAKKIYAFDIQEQAIKTTFELLQENNVTNVQLIQDSHDKIDHYVSELVDLAIYNLGYLPNGDKSIKTNADIVLQSLEKLLAQLNHLAIVVLVIYLHDLEESNKIQDFTKKLDKNYDVLEYKVLNKKNSPYIIKITKI
ncbi:MAG: class I SAM-dependent methyltransferase [Tenericutes bacterium]|nr:class I SAM-dependent methyltransferase [Mycoplasmatota bacterium]